MKINQWSVLRSSNDSFPSYGNATVTSSSNQPGARFGHTMSLDIDRQLIYVFGGYGYDGTMYFYYEENGEPYDGIIRSEKCFLIF